MSLVTPQPSLKKGSEGLEGGGGLGSDGLFGNIVSQAGGRGGERHFVGDGIWGIIQNVLEEVSAEYAGL